MCVVWHAEMSYHVVHSFGRMSMSAHITHTHTCGICSKCTCLQHTNCQLLTHTHSHATLLLAECVQMFAHILCRPFCVICHEIKWHKYSHFKHFVLFACNNLQLSVQFGGTNSANACIADKVISPSTHPTVTSKCILCHHQQYACVLHGVLPAYCATAVASAIQFQSFFLSHVLPHHKHLKWTLECIQMSGCSRLFKGCTTAKTIATAVTTKKALFKAWTLAHANGKWVWVSSNRILKMHKDTKSDR